MEGSVDGIGKSEGKKVELLIFGGYGYSFCGQAKVADFGLLKSGEELDDQGKGVAGTPGYIVNHLLTNLNLTPEINLLRIQGYGVYGFIWCSLALHWVDYRFDCFGRRWD